MHSLRILEMLHTGQNIDGNEWESACMSFVARDNKARSTWPLYRRTSHAGSDVLELQALKKKELGNKQTVGRVFRAR
jgi:hypothetical protein